MTHHSSSHSSQAGFSLPELLISVTMLLIISSAVTSALLQMTSSQRTIWNRTAAPRWRSERDRAAAAGGRTGRQDFAAWRRDFAAAVPIGAQTVGVRVNGAVPATMTGFFVGEQLVVDVGGPTPCVVIQPCAETVTVTAVNVAGKQITATFAYPHNANTSVQALGGFGTGIVPPLAAGFANGSLPSVLKLYGDVNSDGQMVYVEYTCDPAPGGTGNLYRNVMPYDQAPPKLAPNAGQVLLSSIQTNPGGVACFTYMLNPAGAGYIRARRRDHLDREHGGDRPGHQTVPDRNQGALERFTAQRVQRLAAGDGEHQRAPPADAADGDGSSALNQRYPYENGERKRNRASPEPVSAVGDVRHRRIAHVSVADRNVLEHELPADVPGALRGRVGNSTGGQSHPLYVRRAGHRRSRSDCQLQHHRLAGQVHEWLPQPGTAGRALRERGGAVELSQRGGSGSFPGRCRGNVAGRQHDSDVCAVRDAPVHAAD